MGALNEVKANLIEKGLIVSNDARSIISLLFFKYLEDANNGYKDCYRIYKEFLQIYDTHLELSSDVVYRETKSGVVLNRIILLIIFSF